MGILIKGFSKESNEILSETLNFANICKSNKVSTLHLGYVLLNNMEVAKEIEERAGINIGSLGEKILDNIYKAKKSDMDNKQLTLVDTTKEMSALIERIAGILFSNKQLIKPTDLFKQLLLMKDNLFKNTLIESGINISKLLESTGEDGDEQDMQGQRCEIRRVSILSDCGVDITEVVAQNTGDEIVCRDKEIDKVIEALGRSINPHVCLVGELGVGKKSIVVGLAQRIVSGDVPSFLKDKHIINIDIPAVIDMAKRLGGVEMALNILFSELSNDDNVIGLFNDFHSLISSNLLVGEMSAPAIIKKALCDSNIQLIGITNTIAYNQYISSNHSIASKLQTIQVKEPNVDQSIKIIDTIKDRISDFHNVLIGQEVIKASVELSMKYMTSRRLPSKAINILDATASRIKIKHDGKKRKSRVTESDIKETISDMTGIDISEMNKTDKDRLVNLQDKLKEHLIGQDTAVNEVSRAIKRNKAGIRPHYRPIGSFLFVGPTGVGKTELAKVLAMEVFGSDKDIIRFDMSEYMEKHSVSKLIGAPPGYIGSENGGQLTDRVKMKPYSIILLDEVEKAHPDVLNIFLQIMEDGRLTDNKGVVVDFKNTIVIMTSNAGYSLQAENKKSIGFNTSNKEQTVKESNTLKELEKTFRPEFLNRLDKVIVFNKLSHDNINSIVKLMLSEVANNIANENIKVNFSNDLVEHLSKEGFSDKYGARNVRRKIQELVEDYLADLVLTDTIKAGDSITLGIDNGKVCHLITAEGVA